jgi:hypothetical protein
MIGRATTALGHEPSFRQRRCTSALPMSGHTGQQSYFTSWSQSGPSGTMVDLVGMQNSNALNMRPR